ncbi:hypothetical protein [Fusobacterium sp. MFO224]|uniref:hypothetical protein n=1 Tax=Fusobacterium sp. MFO224 TaxID=3378070 RepID=UPI003852B030
MLKIKELLEFKKECYFDGAVQPNWFYEDEKSRKVSEGFVFHGPKYFGVTSNDVGSKKLIDTVSFMKIIYRKLYLDEEINPFMLAISGYGSGKSHLAVNIAKYFSNNSSDDKLREKILNNIKLADDAITNELDLKGKKKNFVIVLNGMNDFNLHYELLKNAKKSLEFYGYSSNILKDLTEAYKIARNFVERNFERENEIFLEKSRKYNLDFDDTNIKNNILEELDTNEDLFKFINEVYEEINGHEIRWDEGISAKVILEKLETELCGNRGDFNKILILFDEFGRYLEYASDFSQKAGDSALQQIFETIQDKDGNIIFLGFIQSDLKTYLTRVDKTSNISRYIGRYDISDKVYLSSNLETIFANLICKKDSFLFEKYIKDNIDRNLKKYEEEYFSIKRWLPTMSKKGVWNEWDKYKTVILEGIYPFNPVAIWMLSSMSEWLQNRSSLTLVKKKLEENIDLQVEEYGDLEYIKPIDIIEGDLFLELLSAEQEGRQRSQFCILYNNILKKYDGKLNTSEREVLLSNLILRILKFKTENKEDIILAIEYISNTNKNKIKEILNYFENEYGIIQYDDISKCYDFIEDAIGSRDFKLFINRKVLEEKVDLRILKEIKFKELLNLDNIKTNFALDNNVVTNEWNFIQDIELLDNVDKFYCSELKLDFLKSKEPNKLKGKVIWVYLNKDSNFQDIEKLKELQSIYFKDTPIVIMLINDKENILYDLIEKYQILNSLKDDEKIKYKKFLKGYEEKLEDAIRNSSYKLKLEKEMVDNGEIKIMEKRLSIYLSGLLKGLYPKMIPFPFDGFSAKSLAKVKQYFLLIARLILSGEDYLNIKNFNVDIRNRFESVLIHSWKVVDSKTLTLITPKNKDILKMFDYFNCKIDKNNNILHLKEIMNELQKVPYGFNDYIMSMIIFIYLSYISKEIKLKVEGKEYSLEKWSQIVIKDKLLDLKYAEKTEVLLIDIDKEKTKALRLLKDIKANTDISLCEKYEEDLNDLKNTLTIKGLEDTLKLVEIQIETGKRHFREFKQYINALNIDISERINDLPFLIKCLKQRYKVTEEVVLEEPFIYTLEQRKIENKIESEIKRIIQKILKDWLKNKVECRKSADADKFQKKMEITAKGLEKLGYVSESRILRKKYEETLKNTKRIKALEHLDKDIRELEEKSINDYTQYVELKEMEGKIKTLNDLIKNSNEIYEEDIEKYEKSMKSLSKNCNVYLKKVDDKIEEIMELMCEVSNIEELKNIVIKIGILLPKGLIPAQKEEFETTINFIQNILKILEKFKNVENSNQLKKLYNEVKENFIDEDYGNDFTQVLNNTIKKVEKEILEKEKRWKENYLVLNIEKSDENKLRRWLFETKMRPVYLSDKTEADYKILKEKIISKLKENKIIYILDLIKNLDIQEMTILKKELKEML